MSKGTQDPRDCRASLGRGLDGQGGGRVQYKNARTGERLVGMETLAHWWLLNT